MGSCLSESKAPPSQTKADLESYHNYDISAHANASIVDTNTEIFNEQFLLNGNMKEEKINSLEELLPLQRIKYIFERYISLTEEKENLKTSNGIYSFINHELGADYNNTQLLNDYYYILFNYDDELEIISNYLTQTISNLNPSNFSYFQRNYRDRSRQSSTRRNTVSPKYVYDIFQNNPKEINTVQIIDKIYCYFIFSMKMGYKLKQTDYIDDEQGNINNNDSNNDNLEDVLRDNKIYQMNGIIKQRADKERLNGTDTMKHKYYINMGSNPETTNIQYHDSSGSESSKMSTSLDMMIDRIPTNQSSIDYTMSATHSSLQILPEIESLGNANKLSLAQSQNIKLFRKKNASTRQYYNDTMIIGYRYYYWEYFMNQKKRDENNPGYMVKDWYIKRKYMTLKEELLSNINCLNVDEYDEIYYKAQNILNCDYTKTITNNHYWYTREYGLRQNMIITLDHIIAASAYCNFYVKSLYILYFDKLCRNKHIYCIQIIYRTFRVHSTTHFIGNQLMKLMIP